MRAGSAGSGTNTIAIAVPIVVVFMVVLSTLSSGNDPYKLDINIGCSSAQSSTNKHHHVHSGGWQKPPSHEVHWERRSGIPPEYSTLVSSEGDTWGDNHQIVYSGYR
uniref:Uncharacterized protein n=1 Tax=Timema monikensis TaxID=170555 RepID=A0A7R9HTS4_9NEOP|nr:unnamed protein product [Timema monikensis]